MANESQNINEDRNLEALDQFFEEYASEYLTPMTYNTIEQPIAQPGNIRELYDSDPTNQILLTPVGAEPIVSEGGMREIINEFFVPPINKNIPVGKKDQATQTSQNTHEQQTQTETSTKRTESLPIVKIDSEEDICISSDSECVLIAEKCQVCELRLHKTTTRPSVKTQTSNADCKTMTCTVLFCTRTDN